MTRQRITPEQIDSIDKLYDGKFTLDKGCCNMEFKRHILACVSHERINITHWAHAPKSEFADVKFDPEYINDWAMDIGYGKIPDKLLIGLNDDDELYLDYKGFDVKHNHEGKEKIDGDVMAFITSHYDLRGSAYRDLLEMNIDLLKFRTRVYDSPKEYDKFEKGKGISDYPELVHVFNDNIHLDNTLDNLLLIKYLKHQLVKRVLKCTYDPFFEKDGLMHVKHNVYAPKIPEYDTPPNLDINALWDSLKICERYHDDAFWN